MLYSATRSCRDCSETKLLEEFAIDSKGPGGRRTQCKACVRQWAKARRVLVGDQENQRRREKHAVRPSQVLLWLAKGRARKIGVPFDLTENDVQVPVLCPALGIPLSTGDGRVGPNSPSVDRIKPELGYVRGNVVVVSHLANRIKSNASPDQLRAVAEFYSAIAERRALLSN